MAGSCEPGKTELLGRLQNGTYKGKGGAADKSTHERMGLGTACREKKTLKDEECFHREL
jgi:hypothetical protein